MREACAHNAFQTRLEVGVQPLTSHGCGQGKNHKPRKHKGVWKFKEGRTDSSQEELDLLTKKWALRNRRRGRVGAERGRRQAGAQG